MNAAAHQLRTHRCRQCGAPLCEAWKQLCAVCYRWKFALWHLAAAAHALKATSASGPLPLKARLRHQSGSSVSFPSRLVTSSCHGPMPVGPVIKTL